VISVETGNEILGRFPIDQLCFLLAGGLFLVFSFPFGISYNADFLRGVPPLNFTNIIPYFKESIEYSADYIALNFSPFVNINYLNDFPNGLIKILLLSFPCGTIFFFFYDVYKRTNHFFKVLFWDYFLKNIINRKNKNEKKENLRDGNDQINLREYFDFFDWIRKKDLGKFFDFMLAMHKITIGLLYSCETYFLISLFSLFAVLLRTGIIHLEWLILPIVLNVFFYIVFRVYDKRYESIYNNLFMGFKECSGDRSFQNKFE